MNKVTFSIEFGHIYTNETFSTEHSNSVKQLKKYLPIVSDEDYQTCVFIDDYNATEHLLDVPDFLSKLGQEGASPDYYAFEANMSVYKDDMINIIQDKKVRKSYERYINGNGGKLPCSFMTTIWYFVRLGLFDADGIVKSNNATKSFLPAKSLINILPERFRAVEAQTLKLVRASRHSQYLSNIDYVFFGDNGKT
jgi:hypothetical protein